MKPIRGHFRGENVFFNPKLMPFLKQYLHYGVLAEHEGLVDVTGPPALWGTRKITSYL